MEIDRSPRQQQGSHSSAAKKPKFSVYQNPTFAAALSASSIRPSASVLLVLSSFSIASALSLLVLSSRGEWLVRCLKEIHISMPSALFILKSLQAMVGLMFVATFVGFIRALLMHTGMLPVRTKGLKQMLSERQLNLLGIKPKPVEKTDVEAVKKPPKSRMVSSEPLVPIRKSSFSYTPTRPYRIGPELQNSSGSKRMAISPVSPSVPLHNRFFSPPNLKLRANAKGIQTESMFEQFLADVDEKICESAIQAATATPPPTIRGFGISTPGSVTSSTTASGAARSTPLRPVRMSPGSHQKYSTPPKKGVGELPLPMSMVEEVEALESLGVYPQIEQWQDQLRQWFSSMLINPLLEKIESSHIQVMHAAANVGVSITVSQVGSDSTTTTLPVNGSPLNVSKEWQPTFTLDEDGMLHQLHSTLLQARDASAGHSPLAGFQQQPNPLLSLIQACVDAITEHQRLNTLMKGELIKGLLPQSSVRADYAVQRVRELAEGTCLKNYDYLGNGDGSDKTSKKYVGELPTDSHLLLYLFSAFLEHPKWMLHVDPVSYSGAQSSKNPLFLGVLPPKDRFPEKYVAIISGIPSVIHPGACILAVGKQSPPTFALYWDKKLQFSLQGRTALWDAILLLCHRIKLGYGAVVRGVHLGSSALNLLTVLDTDNGS